MSSPKFFNDPFDCTYNLIKEKQIKPVDGFYVPIQNNVWQLSFLSQQDIRVLVFDFAQVNGLKTLQLTVKNKNLESVFRELTQS